MLSHILNSHEPKVENVEAANQVVETAHDILSSTIKRRLYEQFLQGKNKRKRNNRDSSSIQNHLEMTGNGQSVRWQTDDTEVRLPKFVEYILRLRNFGWLLLLLLFVLFLPVIIALVLLGMILWFILSPIVRIIRTWYPSVRETHAASETQSSPFSFFRHRRIRSGNFLCLPIGS